MMRSWNYIFVKGKKCDSSGVSPLEKAVNRKNKSIDDLSLKKKRKRKTKSPSAVATDGARRQRFWKQKKSVTTSHLNDRQQQTEENTVLEEENPIYTDSECSSGVSTTPLPVI